jgi:methionine-S-sulfoxide reductase
MQKSPRFLVFAILPLSIVTIGIGGCGTDTTAGVEGESRSAPAQSDQSDQSAEASVAVEEDSSVARPSRASGELVLAGGCFWCMEAVFEQLRGVSDVVSGYAGGSAEDADYLSVANGLTGHAEAIRITYDPQTIDEQTLLKVFFIAHDPTQVNGQYPDIGPQYRSAVFYTSDGQKQRVEEMITQLDGSGRFDRKIATSLEPLKEFHAAEDYHQDYAKSNPDVPYVVVHSRPKAAKVCQVFPELIQELQGLRKPTEGKDNQDGGGRSPTSTSE